MQSHNKELRMDLNLIISHKSTYKRIQSKIIKFYTIDDK